MAIRTTAAKSIDEYIAASPSDVQPSLKKIRMTISAAAPGAQEVISYRMPAFRLHGILVTSRHSRLTSVSIRRYRGMPA